MNMFRNARPLARLIRSAHTDAKSAKPVKKTAAKAPRKAPARNASSATAKPMTEPQVVAVPLIVDSTASPTIDPEAIPTSEAPGIPPAAEPDVEVPKVFVNSFSLPDISREARPEIHDPVQIPFVPDFWDSSKVPSLGDVQEKAIPKILDVSGGKYINHNHDSSVPSPSESSESNSRPLTQDESRGAWVLLAGLFGTFFVSRALGGPKKEEH